MESTPLDPKTVKPDPSRPYLWLLLGGSLLTTGLLIFAALKENYLSEWHTTQRQYRTFLQQKATDALGRALLRDFRIELKQISVPALNAVDRCVTCHTGIDDPRTADLPQPFRTHPGNILAKHPVDRFGCTVCHLGQGLAVSYEDAAHKALEFWERPMLKGDYLQASCAKCHLEPDFSGTPLLAAGRKMFSEDFSCNTCHMIRGEGGRDCADLTFVGSRSVRTFDFNHLKGERTRLRWFFEHFKNPQAVVPGSDMPNMEMSDEQARALTAFMLSLTDDQIPSSYLARKAARLDKALDGAANSSEGLSKRTPLGP